MQPFPTAFWKKGEASVTPEPEVSCIDIVNSTETEEGSNEFYLNDLYEATDGIGLYVDWTYSGSDNSSANLRTQNRFVGFLGDGTIDDVEVEDFMAYLSLWPIFQASRHQGYDLDKLETVKSFLRARDIEDVITPLEQANVEYDYHFAVMEKHFSYVWMKHFDFSDNFPIHKTHPVTITKSEDCQTATVKCYFEKDFRQKVLEIDATQKFNNSYNLGANYALIADESLKSMLENYPYIDSLYDVDVRRGIQNCGYNGYHSEFINELQYLYKQKAKVRLVVEVNETKTLSIKVKGLGTDDNGRTYSNKTIFENHISENNAYTKDRATSEAKFLSGNDVEFDEDGALVDDNHGFYYYNGDRQTCDIYLNDVPKIRASAPKLGVFSLDRRFSLPDEGYVIEGFNYAKGPVRVFEYISKDANNKWTLQGTGGDDVSTVGTRGTDYHYAHGLEYLDIQPSNRNESYGVYTPDDANFYDYQSIKSTNLDAPTYSSPYQFVKDITIEAGSHNVDIIFDSTYNENNGGAYYEIEISTS